MTNWNYAVLSKAAKSVGGPEKFVESMIANGLKKGLKSGRKEGIIIGVCGSLFVGGVAYITHVSNTNNKINKIAHKTSEEIAKVVSDSMENEALNDMTDEVSKDTINES